MVLMLPGEKACHKMCDVLDIINGLTDRGYVKHACRLAGALSEGRWPAPACQLQPLIGMLVMATMIAEL